jgi:hypothetical protein
MKTLRSSPCRREGVSPDNQDFPCLEPGWGNQPCPMNEGCREWMRERESEMYQLGYPYAAWVVKKDLLGLSPVCSLVYFRERPTPADVEEVCGKSVLHVADATPAPDDTPKT